jgi:hypothetical protein
MSQDVVNLEMFKGGPAEAFKQALDATESLSEGIGQSYGVIGYRGKEWSLRYRGETYPFLDPKTNAPAAYIDVVILRQGKEKSKSYYKQFDESAAAGGRPLCASVNGIIPDPGVEQKQAEACAVCPRNEWKMQANGRMGRECSDFKRLAVLVIPEQTARMFSGTALLEPIFLRVPPASLYSLAQMGDIMAGQGYPYSSFVTRVTFAPKKAYPEMVFTPVNKVAEQASKAVLDMRDSPIALRIIGEDQARLAGPAHMTVLPAGQGQQAIPAPAQPPTAQRFTDTPAVALTEPLPSALPQQSMAAASAPMTVAPALATVAPAPATVAPAPATVAPAPMVVADDPQESDADLDAHIDAILNPNKS